MKAIAVMGFMATASGITRFKNSMLRDQPTSASNPTDITAALEIFGSLDIEEGVSGVVLSHA